MAAGYRGAFLRHAKWSKWVVGVLWCAAGLGALARLWPGRVWVEVSLAALVAMLMLSAWMRARRDQLIREGALPHFLKRKLRDAYPHLSQKEADLVERGLRQFLLACHRSKGRFVAMPSRVVGAMWHEFVLHTHAYRDWCELALGRFLPHAPAEALGAHAQRNDGLRRAWFWSCRDESIDPRSPTRLPLLFALDGKLNIEGGLRYVADCSGKPEGDRVHCGTSFCDASFSGDADGFGGSEAPSGDGGDGGAGDGGGDGGGGGD